MPPSWCFFPRFQVTLDEGASLSSSTESRHFAATGRIDTGRGARAGWRLQVGWQGDLSGAWLPLWRPAQGRREARINGHFIRVNTASGHACWGQEGQARGLSTKGFFIRLSIRHEKRSLKAPFDSVHSCSHRLTGPPRPCRRCAAECGTPPDAGTGRGHRAPPRSAPARRRRARG